MIVERKHNGSYEISAIVGDHLLSRVYYFYTRREAIAEFKEEVKAEKQRLKREAYSDSLAVWEV